MATLFNPTKYVFLHLIVFIVTEASIGGTQAGIQRCYDSCHQTSCFIRCCRRAGSGKRGRHYGINLTRRLRTSRLILGSLSVSSIVSCIPVSSRSIPGYKVYFCSRSLSPLSLPLPVVDPAYLLFLVLYTIPGRSPLRPHCIPRFHIHLASNAFLPLT